MTTRLGRDISSRMPRTRRPRHSARRPPRPRAALRRRSSGPSLGHPAVGAGRAWRPARAVPTSSPRQAARREAPARRPRPGLGRGSLRRASPLALLPGGGSATTRRLGRDISSRMRAAPASHAAHRAGRRGCECLGPAHSPPARPSCPSRRTAPPAGLAMFASGRHISPVCAGSTNPPHRFIDRIQTGQIRCHRVNI